MGVTLDQVIPPNARESEIARESSRKLSPFARRSLCVTIPKPGTAGKEEIDVELPAQAVAALVTILTEMAEGNAVTLIPVHAELTTSARNGLFSSLASRKPREFKARSHKRFLRPVLPCSIPRQRMNKPPVSATNHHNRVVRRHDGKIEHAVRPRRETPDHLDDKFAGAQISFRDANDFDILPNGVLAVIATVGDDCKRFVITPGSDTSIR
jgi:hypothetical protein